MRRALVRAAKKKLIPPLRFDVAFCIFCAVVGATVHPEDDRFHALLSDSSGTDKDPETAPAGELGETVGDATRRRVVRRQAAGTSALLAKVEGVESHDSPAELDKEAKALDSNVNASGSKAVNASDSKQVKAPGSKTVNATGSTAVNSSDLKQVTLLSALWPPLKRDATTQKVPKPDRSAPKETTGTPRSAAGGAATTSATKAPPHSALPTPSATKPGLEAPTSSSIQGSLTTAGNQAAAASGVPRSTVWYFGIAFCVAAIVLAYFRLRSGLGTACSDDSDIAGGDGEPNEPLASSDAWKRTVYRKAIFAASKAKKPEELS
eukprot:TRINITY_DN34925_c0_g1_i1.p1 TRINITY_DN34925_c0_g1~~TRINITY_DN34925_c0_g1_i1.p1  ORF type:complete len:321 (+),score=55.33 TRINITY_DN34925_c0_g1_i1:122-1084(+)